MKKIITAIAACFLLSACQKQCIYITDYQGQELCYKCFKSKVEYDIWVKKFGNKSPQEQCDN